MIQFFRKIRFKLFEGGQLGRYLMYAVGEILLVVIGILIALQVNNWNNSQNDREKEVYYLNSIRSGIEVSQEELTRVIEDSEYIGQSAASLLIHLANKDLDSLKAHRLDSLMLGASDYSIMSLNDEGIQEILNTGSLDLIGDEQIRQILASWEETLHNIRKFEEETQFIARHYVEYIDQYIDFGLWVTNAESAILPEKREELYNDPVLRNHLGRISGTHGAMNDRYLKGAAKMDSLATLIDAYLDQ